ncbi:protein of unknown function [Chryseobacterium sp. JV274]|nr:protein of unknown function [Chryseobacterium sp. JV274]
MCILTILKVNENDGYISVLTTTLNILKSGTIKKEGTII